MLGASQIAEAGVSDHPIEPGFEARAWSVARPGAIHLEEDVLGQLLSPRPTLDELHGKPDHPGHMFFEQLAKRSLAALLHLQHELHIGIPVGVQRRTHSIKRAKSVRVAGRALLKPGAWALWAAGFSALSLACVADRGIWRGCGLPPFPLPPRAVTAGILLCSPTVRRAC